MAETVNYLHQIEDIETLQEEWKKIEQEMGVAGIRWLCRNDLYYLLVKVCRRTDMTHPWVMAKCREVEGSPDGHLDLWAR